MYFFVLIIHYILQTEVLDNRLYFIFLPRYFHVWNFYSSLESYQSFYQPVDCLPTAGVNISCRLILRAPLQAPQVSQNINCQNFACQNVSCVSPIPTSLRLKKKGGGSIPDTLFGSDTTVTLSYIPQLGKAAPQVIYLMVTAEAE